MSFYLPIILFAGCLIWCMIDLIGFREGCEYLQTHFILKNKILKKIVFPKPLRDPANGNKRQEIPIFKFIPYLISWFLLIITSILTIVYGIAKTSWIEKILTNRITLIVLFVYIALIVINTIILVTIDNILSAKEWNKRFKH